MRKNRHRAPDSTKAGALELWRGRLCVGGARRKQKRAVAMECVEMLRSNGGEGGREGERRRGREQGLQEPGDAGLGQEGKPLPFRSLRVPYEFPKRSLVLPFLGFTSCQGALKSFHICDPVFPTFHFSFYISFYIFNLD